MSQPQGIDSLLNLSPLLIVVSERVASDISVVFIVVWCLLTWSMNWLMTLSIREDGKIS